MIFGILGLLFLLFAFFMNLLNKWDSSNNRYLYFNIIGCTFMLFYDYSIGWSLFAPLQIIWGLSAVVKLVIK